MAAYDKLNERIAQRATSTVTVGDPPLGQLLGSATKVLVVEWGNSGRSGVVSYIPGLWETRLKHLTRGAL